MKKYWKKLKKLMTNHFVLKCFFTLLAIFAALLICFMSYTRSNSAKALEIEYTNYSELQTARTVEHMDDYFKSYSRITALLAMNNTIRIYLFDENADELFTDIYNQIYNQLASYKEGFSAIDSIYLFQASGTEVLCSDSPIPRSSLDTIDKNCLTPEEAPAETTFIPREKNNRYPYLMTIYVPVYESSWNTGRKGLIALNINISEIPLLQSEKSDSFQAIYLISDDGQLLYRNKQKDIPESLDLIAEMCHFDNSIDHFSQYINEDSPYIYVQQHSVNYPWYYVTITKPQSYVNKPHDIYSAVVLLLPWLVLFSLVIIIGLVLLATHPMCTISDFLENPLTEVPENISEPETKKIIRQFINYIQTNHSLSQELNHQMELQNKATFVALQSQINPHFLFNTLNIIRNMEIETLGYDHEAPELTLTLSRLLQYAISSADLVPLKTEFFYMDYYLKILNQRYKKKLHFTIHRDEGTSEVLVPKLFLQPLIENAIFHGCSPNLNEHNQICINAQIDQEMCLIQIQDNGIGISEEELNTLRRTLKDSKSIPSNSIGLQNVALRMYLTYGDSFSLDIKSQLGTGTCISLIFPASIQNK